MPNNHRIPEIIADPESQEVPDVSSTAEKYGILSRTLRRHWKGETTIIKKCIFTYRQMPYQLTRASTSTAY